jgi:2-amino-4-hydroxy-6-hydroxymethyldihydropteridine diphosphokinase
MGSNLGDRLGWLQFGMEGLARLGTILRFSNVYETEPWDVQDQPPFLNAVCALMTDIVDPLAFLTELKAIETTAGREMNAPKWSARVLDLDLLFWGRLIHQTDSLVIPHPSLSVRRFVLVPLCEVAPDLIHPGLGLTVEQMLKACPDRGKAQFWGKLL